MDGWLEGWILKNRWMVECIEENLMVGWLNG